MKRWRESIWVVAPLVVLVILTWPIWWLFHLPTDLRFARLDARATTDVDIDLTFVRAVRWFTRGIDWSDEDHYFELDFVHGKVVVKDDYERRLHYRLEVLGLLPAPIALGRAHSGYELFAWMPATLLVVVVLVLGSVCC